MNRFAKRIAAGAGLVFLCTFPELTRAQNLPPAPAQPPRKTTAPLIRPKRAPGPTDDFAGLTYTPEQKAKVQQIHQDFKKLMDTVRKDQKLSPEQRGAMLQGYQHMERGEVYKVLTAEQQMEVRKKIFARRAEARQDREKQMEKEQHPPQSPTSPQSPQTPPAG
jgi:Spy/CpxP family protein refolding chaperone